MSNNKTLHFIYILCYHVEKDVSGMKVLNEAGVLARSERFFSTPSATARGLFFYVTRVGHYYYDEKYNFLDSCDVAHQESHKNFYLAYIRSGTMYFETTQVFTAERGQVALIDCHKPHRFFTAGPAESMWIHFDGANAAAFFNQIIAFRSGRQTFDPPAGGHIEQEMAQIISGLRSASMSEVDCSQRIYHILCSLLFPQHKAVKQRKTTQSPEQFALLVRICLSSFQSSGLRMRLISVRRTFRACFAAQLAFPHMNISCCTGSMKPKRCFSQPVYRSKRSHFVSATAAK